MRFAALTVSLAFAVSLAACGDNLPGNSPPDVAPRSAATPEDTPVSITVVAEDAESDALTFEYSQPEHGTITGSGATITYRPDDDYNGPDEITVTVGDGDSTASALISITVMPVNDNPVAGDDALAANEDVTSSVDTATLLANDTDVDGDALTITAVATPSSGTVVLAGPLVSYTPADDFTGTATFEYTVSDGNGGTDTGVVTVTVGGENDPPIAVDDTQTTAEDTALVIASTVLTANDTDDDGQALSVTMVSGEMNGTVALAGGTITFTPAANFHGTAGFDYVVSDGAATDTGHVTVTVTPVNDTPVATAGTATTAEDMPVTITIAGTDADGDTLTAAIGTAPTGGTLGPVTRVNATSFTVVYTPNSNFNSSDSFTFTVNDGTATSAAATVMITVTPANDGPTAMPASVMTAEDTPLDIVLTGTDPDGNALTFAIGTGPTGGTLGTITQLTPTTARVTYTPNGNFNGADGFTFTVNDGTTTSAAATVMITVTPANDAPVATAQAVTTAEEMAVTITLAGTDADGDPLTFAIAGGPTGGTLGAITQATPTTATVVYTPDANFSGTDGFTFTVNDGTVTSPAAAVGITVTPVNDGPTAMPAGVMTAEDTALDIVLTGTDGDGDALTFAIAGGPTSGTLGAITQLTPTTARVTYTPNGNFNGSDSFTFTVNDGTSTSAAAAVMITVTPANDGPTATPQSVTTAEEAAVTITLAGTDLDGDPLTFAIAGGPAHGTLGTITQATPTTATVTYTPAADYSGPDSFTFTVNDGTVTSAPATVSLTVTAVNDPPVATNDTDIVERDTPKTQPFSFYLANDTDGGDGGPLTITLVDTFSNGTAAIAGTSIVFTPEAGYVGPASFRYHVSDGTDTRTAIVSITVIETNTPVIAVDDVDTVAEDAVLTRSASVYTANDIDPDPQTLTITAVFGAVNGTVDLTGTTITFTPDAGYNGAAQFDYTVTDGVASDTGRVGIIVTAVNDPPDAVDDTTTVAEDGSVGVPVLANDSNDDGALTISAFTQGANGTVTQTLNTLTYAPAANFNGTDTFTYTAQDPGGLTDTATVTVTVTPANDAPIFADTELTIPENAPRTLTLSATDVDVPAQTLTFTVANPPDFGTLGAITPTGPATATVVYTPNSNYVGDDFMHFTVSDGADSDLGIVSLHITNVVACGDGTREGAEACDDGNVANGDGCAMGCTVEQGWDCGAASPSVCATICGDDFIVATREECDDGNAIDTDGCTTQCQSGPVCAATVPALAGGDRFAVDPANGNCYVSFDDDMATFADAQTACIAAGGHLASITSSNEQAIVSSVHNPLQNPWIGLTDELVEGSFGWITGEPLSFTNFAMNQPDGGDPEDCVNLFAASIAPSSAWNDTSCTFTGFVEGRICELEANSCGDGIVHASRGEACDDRNTVSGDGCSATCTVEAGAICTGTAPTTCAKIVLNEVEYDNQGTDNQGGQFEFVEILSTGTAPYDMTNIALILMNSNASPATEYFFDTTTGAANVAKRLRLNTATGLTGNLLPPGEMIVVSGAGLLDTLPSSVHKLQIVFPNGGFLQGGAPDAVALFNVSGTGAVVDTLSYEGNTPTGTVIGFAGTFPLTEGTGHVAGDPAPSGGPYVSLQRVPNGRDTQNNSVDFVLRPVTPGAPNPGS